jgi:ATP synthase protein I
MTASQPDRDEKDPLIDSLRVRGARHQRWQQEGEQSTARRLGQIGVLGWIIVVPTLAGAFAGGWLDNRFNSGVFCTAPMLMLGLALGCWSAWKWVQSS